MTNAKSESETVLRSDSNSDLVGRLKAIRAALRALESDPSDQGVLLDLRRMLHQLRGSAATAGYALVGDIAANMEAFTTASPGTIPPEDLDRLAAATEEIEVTLSERRSDSAPRGDRCSLLVADRGTGLARGVERLGRQRPWDVDIVGEGETAPSRLKEKSYDAVVLLGDADHRWTAAEVRAFGEVARTPPLVVVQPSTETAERVSLATAGVSHSLGSADMHDLGVLLDDVLPTRRSDRGSILIVDDDPVFRGALITVLRPLGWQVTALGDSSRAFEVIADQSPHILIIDMEMPSPGGVELVRALRTTQEWHATPVVMVTAHADRDRQFEGYRAGADLVIDKAAGSGAFRAELLRGLRRLERRGRSLPRGLRARPPVDTAAHPSLGDVIIIEDDKTLLEMLEYALRNEGHVCTTFSNGRKALEELMQADVGQRRPVVVLDVDLPGLDGFTILQEIEQARGGQFQILITTVHNSEREQVKALRSGATDYIVKPVSVPVLLAKIERLLQEGPS